METGRQHKIIKTGANHTYYTDSVRIPVTRVIRACNGEDESEVCRWYPHTI